MRNGLRLAVPAGDPAADEGMGPLDFMGDRLPDVVEERGAPSRLG
jgi:hypothetical protein